MLCYGGKIVAQKVQIILVQSNDKWFYSLVIRQFCKCIPLFGTPTKKLNVTAEFWVSGAHEEGHKYNPSHHLSPNLLDAFNHYVEDDHLDYDYFKEAYEKLDLNNIYNPLE